VEGSAQRSGDGSTRSGCRRRRGTCSSEKIGACRGARRGSRAGVPGAGRLRRGRIPPGLTLGGWIWRRTREAGATAQLWRTGWNWVAAPITEQRKDERGEVRVVGGAVTREENKFAVVLVFSSSSSGSICLCHCTS
jgi:hypothetical protein